MHDFYNGYGADEGLQPGSLDPKARERARAEADARLAAAKAAGDQQRQIDEAKMAELKAQDEAGKAYVSAAKASGKFKSEVAPDGLNVLPAWFANGIASVLTSDAVAEQPFNFLFRSDDTIQGFVDPSSSVMLKFSDEVKKGKAILVSNDYREGAFPFTFILTSNPLGVAKRAGAGGGYSILAIQPELRAKAAQFAKRAAALAPSSSGLMKAYDQVKNVASTAVGVASVYHGYKRNNNSIAWGLAWGAFGTLFWYVAAPVMLAQGFGKSAGGSAPALPAAAQPAVATPNRRRRRR